MKIYMFLCIVLGFGAFTANGQALLTKKELMDVESSPMYTEMCKRFPYLTDINFYQLTYLSDSVHVNGFLIAPKKEGNYPGIIYNRGGNRNYGAVTFKKMLAIGLAELAAEGYAVAISQYRGNGGSEGQEEFGGADVDDVLNLIETLNEIPEVDTSKLGMYGWSRGGMMTYQALVRSHKIKAVVVGGGCSDLATNMKTRPGFEQNVYEELIPNYTTNSTAELAKRSAINWVDKFPKNVPILILHGGSDGNVRPQQALKLSLALDEQRVPYKLIIYEGDNHGIQNNREQVQHEVKQWFQRYLKDNETVPDMNYRISN